MNLSRCECHDCTQARAREGLGSLGRAFQSTTPKCPKHNEIMFISFHDRPGSPQGNGWVCRSCINEREVADAIEKMANPKSKRVNHG